MGALEAALTACGIALGAGDANPVVQEFRCELFCVILCKPYVIDPTVHVIITLLSRLLKPRQDPGILSRIGLTINCHLTGS